MIIRNALLIAAVASISGGALAQTTAAQPSGQSMGNMQGMGKMPGMSGGSSTDMAAMMKHCAQMKAQMKSGTKVSPDMQPMMAKCNAMDRSMGATTKAPDDTLSR